MDTADVSAERSSRLRPLLRCPQCRGALNGAAGHALDCAACGVTYDALNGRPLLMLPQTQRDFGFELKSVHGQRMVEEYGQVPATASTPRWIAWLRPPTIMHRYHEDLLRGPSAPLFTGPPGLTLNVGGGPYRVTETEFTLNIGPFANVDLIADAHNIPLADASVDNIFSLAVLEHVADPQQVVAEMLRVLKPGGYLYSELPFIFFFHGYPTDYTRFTREGVRRLFAALEEVEIGMTHGPVSAVLQSGNMVLELLLPARPRLLRKLVNGTYRLLLFPFKYLDLMLRRHPQAHILAGGFYVRGRKPADA